MSPDNPFSTYGWEQLRQYLLQQKFPNRMRGLHQWLTQAEAAVYEQLDAAAQEQFRRTRRESQLFMGIWPRFVRKNTIELPQTAPEMLRQIDRSIHALATLREDNSVDIPISSVEGNVRVHMERPFRGIQIKFEFPDPAFEKNHRRSLLELLK